MCVVAYIMLKWKYCVQVSIICVTTKIYTRKPNVSVRVMNFVVLMIQIPPFVQTHATYQGLTTLWEFIFCPQEPFKWWHARECIYGECEFCRVDTLPISPFEEKGGEERQQVGNVLPCKNLLTKGRIIKKKNLN